jgi:hypothetical protein
MTDIWVTAWFKDMYDTEKPEFVGTGSTRHEAKTALIDKVLADRRKYGDFEPHELTRKMAEAWMHDWDGSIVVGPFKVKEKK